MKRAAQKPAPAQAWQARLAHRVDAETTRGLTQGPKGLYRYRSHAEANADAERWRAEALERRAREDTFSQRLRRLVFTRLGHLILRR